MSPRTEISWAENMEILKNPERAFRLCYLNKCEDAARDIVAEY